MDLEKENSQSESTEVCARWERRAKEGWVIVKGELSLPIAPPGVQLPLTEKWK